MKRIFVTAAALLMMAGCKENRRQDLSFADNLQEDNHEVKDEHTELYGVWTGQMVPDYDVVDSDVYGFEEPRTLRIKIHRITGNTVYGQKRIAGGNFTSLKGSYNDEDGKILIVLNEPGNNEFDGRLELEVVGKELNGKFRPFKTFKEAEGFPNVWKISASHSDFKYDPTVMLEGRKYIDMYNPKKVSDKSDSGEKAFFFSNHLYRETSEKVIELNASTIVLTEASLKMLRKIDLEIIRNTIYARHGFSFKTDLNRYFFEYCSWYVPISDNVEKDLTQLEKNNIALLMRMEKYATDHYEHLSFGR